MGPSESRRHPPATKITLEQQLFLDLVKTQQHLLFQFACLLRKHGLTEPQFNVLRILRGAGPLGLPCQRIAERMLTHLPDITRLMDRLEAGGLVTRVRRLATDRRLVLNRITDRGKKRIAKLDVPVRELHEQQFSCLTRADCKQLRSLLAKVRQ